MPGSDAVSIAMERATGCLASVGREDFGLYDKVTGRLIGNYPLPAEVSLWVDEYDAGGNVGPFNFTVEIEATHV